MKKTITYKEIKDKVLDIINNGGGGGIKAYENILSTPVTGGVDTVITLSKSIKDAVEMCVEVGYYEESVGVGYTHVNSFIFTNNTLDRIRSNYNKDTIGAIDVYLLADNNANNGYWANFMIDFTSETTAKIKQKIVNGFSPATKCAILSISIK